MRFTRTETFTNETSGCGFRQTRSERCTRAVRYGRRWKRKFTAICWSLSKEARPIETETSRLKMLRFSGGHGWRKPKARLDKLTVVVGAPYWVLNGVNVFSVNLVRGLLSQGISAHILLTEEDSNLVNV